MPGHFTKWEKKKVLFLFLETVAVSFKWWVYEICCHGNCKVGVLGHFFLPWVLNFYFEKQMYRNLYLGIKRGLLHRVEKVCRKKVLTIVTALQKTNPISDLCLFFSPPLWNGYIGRFIWCRRSLYFYRSL